MLKQSWSPVHVTAFSRGDWGEDVSVRAGHRSMSSLSVEQSPVHVTTFSRGDWGEDVGVKAELVTGPCHRFQ